MFTYDVYKFNLFDDHLTIPEHLIELSFKELEKPEVQEHQSCNLDKGEDIYKAWSSFETPANSFFSFQESDKLLNWFKEKVIEVGPHLGFTNFKSVDLTIDWMNVMYRNAYGNCHTHDDDSELDSIKKIVAVFYLKAPNNSAKLLGIKNIRDYSARGIDPFTLPQDEIVEIEVQTGDLLLHRVEMPHAVGRHLTDEPRLCLVMEFRYNEK